MKHTLSQIFQGLDCLVSKQHHCAGCPFNPHPGMEWPYGCIKGQTDIVEEVKEAFTYTAAGFHWWEDLKHELTIQINGTKFSARQKMTCDYVLTLMKIIEKEGK